MSHAHNPDLLKRLKRAQDMPSTMPDTLVAFGIRRGGVSVYPVGVLDLLG